MAAKKKDQAQIANLTHEYKESARAKSRDANINWGDVKEANVNMLFEGLKEKGSMIIVPSSALETMNLGAIGGMAALSQARSSDEQE